jgi:hypothetical protein
MDLIQLRPTNRVSNGIISTIQYREGVWGCIITQSLFSSGHDWVFYKADDIHPMKINSQILLEMGFEYRDGWEDRYVNDRLKIYGNPMKEGWTIENIEPNFEIHYVHQLQNLYYSLAGFELVVPSGSAKI